MSGCACRQNRCILCKVTLPVDGGESKQICEVRDTIEREVFRPHEMLFQQGMPVTDVFVLKHGYVKLTADLPDGRSQGLQVGTQWELVGAEALNAETYPCSAEAVTDVLVCSIPRDEFLSVIQNDAQASWHVISMLNRQLRNSIFQVRNLGLMDATERIASFLNWLQSSSVNGEEAIPLPFTRGDIGQVLGLTMETVSRVMNRLKKEGVIDMPSMGRQFRILDPKRLSSLCGCTPSECA